MPKLGNYRLCRHWLNLDLSQLEGILPMAYRLLETSKGILSGRKEELGE